MTTDDTTDDTPHRSRRKPRLYCMHVLTPAPPPFPHRRKPRLYCTRRSTSRRRSRCVSEALHVAACKCSPRRPHPFPTGERGPPRDATAAQAGAGACAGLRWIALDCLGLPKPAQVHAAARATHGSACKRSPRRSTLLPAGGCGCTGDARLYLRGASEAPQPHLPGLLVA